MLEVVIFTNYAFDMESNFCGLGIFFPKMARLTSTFSASYS